MLCWHKQKYRFTPFLYNASKNYKCDRFIIFLACKNTINVRCSLVVQHLFSMHRAQRFILASQNNPNQANQKELSLRLIDITQ